ncbi:hypothetical protein SGLAM104S_09458 [Streptomyces glaucescens]
MIAWPGRLGISRAPRLPLCRRPEPAATESVRSVRVAWAVCDGGVRIVSVHRGAGAAARPRSAEAPGGGVGARRPIGAYRSRRPGAAWGATRPRRLIWPWGHFRPEVGGLARAARKVSPEGLSVQFIHVLCYSSHCSGMHASERFRTSHSPHPRSRRCPTSHACLSADHCAPPCSQSPSPPRRCSARSTPPPPRLSTSHRASPGPRSATTAGPTTRSPTWARPRPRAPPDVTAPGAPPRRRPGPRSGHPRLAGSRTGPGRLLCPGRRRTGLGPERFADFLADPAVTADGCLRGHPVDLGRPSRDRHGRRPRPGRRPARHRPRRPP